MDSELHSAASAMTMKDIKDNLSYWLALEASSFVYKDDAGRAAALEADNTCFWRLDCGNLCEHTATAKLRKETKQFMTFDVQIAGGTLDEEWHVFLLAFRGTVTLQDWLTNAAAVRNLQPFDQIAVEVHAGWHAYVSETAQHDELKTAISGLPDATSILVCGHSLGGALSQIAMLFLWLQMEDQRGSLYGNQLVRNARCITFGSPAPFAESEASNPAKRRARNAAFEWIQNQCFNFANIKDPVPRLPFDAGKVTWMKLPESLELLQEYDHKCSHVILTTDDSRFQPLNPYEAVRKMQEESPSIPWFEPEKEHKIDKYMNLMRGLLKQALAAGSQRPLRVAGLKLEVQDGSLEERWTEVSSDLQSLSRRGSTRAVEDRKTASTV